MRTKIAFVYLLSTPLDNIAARFRGEDLVIQEIVMPLGLMYLSSYIKNNNEVDVVGVIDYVINERNILKFSSLEEFIKDVAINSIKSAPDILAFSLNLSTSHHFFLLCVDVLKSVWPKTVVLVGGVHATNYTLRLLETGRVDYVFRGEGEVGLSKYLKQHQQYQTINVKGLYSKECISAIKVLDLCEYIDDLDSIPFPDWELIDMERYITGITRFPKKHGDSQSRMAEIITTRGCPFRCTFCSSHTVHGRKVRVRSSGNVANEIRQLFNQYRVTTFFPEDDAFTINKKRTLDLLATLRELEIPCFEMQFPNGLSVASTDEEVVDSLIESGMKMATLAIESGSPYVQKHIINKSCDLEKARRLVAYIQGKGIRVRCYFIFGFPGETKEMMAESEKYIESLGADWYDFFVATPLIGSDMYDSFIKRGYITDDSLTWKSGFFWKRNFDTVEIGAEELNNYVYRLNLKYNFLENVNRRSGRFVEAIEIYEGILNKYPYHVIGWYCKAECFKSMGDVDKECSTREHLTALIRLDKRAKEMFEKYKDLMPNFQL